MVITYIGDIADIGTRAASCGKDKIPEGIRVIQSWRSEPIFDERRLNPRDLTIWRWRKYAAYMRLRGLIS
jgi:hypothetical protein